MPDGQETPPNGGQGGDPPTPKYVTEEQIAQIVNSAVTTHLKRGLAKAIDEAIAPLKQKLETPPPSGDGGGKGKEADPEVVALRKQLDDLKGVVKASQEAASAAEKRAADERAYNALRSELSGKVRPEALDVATDYLFRAQGRVVIDEQTGEPRFKHRTALVAGMPEEDHLFPLSDGVKQFLKGKEAQLFLPAPNTAPNPQRPGPRSTTPGQLPTYEKPPATDDEKVRRAMEAEAAFTNRNS